MPAWDSVLMPLRLVASNMAARELLPPPGYPGPQCPPGTPQPGVISFCSTGAFGQPQVPGNSLTPNSPTIWLSVWAATATRVWSGARYGARIRRRRHRPKSRTWLWILIGVGMVLESALAGVLVMVATKTK